MAKEAKRACGYRKKGGLYLCSDGLGIPCCKLPILLERCPTCDGGIKQSRGWQWIDPRPFLQRDCAARVSTGVAPMFACPAADQNGLGERVGLLWVGEKFYPTPASFAAECAAMGMSKRIQAIPHGFELGKTWVMLAHPKVKEVIEVVIDPDTGEQEEQKRWIGGVFRLLQPSRVEKIIGATEAGDEDAMKKLEERGITPIVVPDDDPDHSGSVYDKAEQEELPLA